MTALLRRAIERASRLPAQEQNALAAFVLAELDGGTAWEDVFGVDEEPRPDERAGEGDVRDQAADRYR